MILLLVNNVKKAKSNKNSRLQTLFRPKKTKKRHLSMKHCIKNTILQDNVNNFLFHVFKIQEIRAFI